jgi:hypothetical protein
MKKQRQQKLFDDRQWYDEHWQGMPEFYQEDHTSDRQIIVHFRNSEDLKKFSELINQPITPKQKSLWYPQLDVVHHTHKVYVDSES